MNEGGRLCAVSSRSKTESGDRSGNQGQSPSVESTYSNDTEQPAGSSGIKRQTGLEWTEIDYFRPKTSE